MTRAPNGRIRAAIRSSRCRIVSRKIAQEHVVAASGERHEVRDRRRASKVGEHALRRVAVARVRSTGLTRSLQAIEPRRDNGGAGISARGGSA
jgi:hypothetical protein